MFEVLKNRESTMEDLAQACVKVMKMQETLETALRQDYRVLMDLQKDCLDPEKKESKELKEARHNYESSCIKLDSYHYGMNKIKDRMIARLDMESKTRGEEIRQAMKALREKERDLMKRYLQKIAEALVIEEEIRGIAYVALSRDGSLTESPLRNTRLELLSIEDAHFLKEEIKRHRQPDGKSIQLQISNLSAELSRLEKVLAFDDEQRKEHIEVIISQAVKDTPPAASVEASAGSGMN